MLGSNRRGDKGISYDWKGRRNTKLIEGGKKDEERQMYNILLSNVDNAFVFGISYC